MIHGHFLDGDQRDELERIVRRPSAVYGVARRANAILLLDDGLNFDQVAKVLYLDDSTIRDWHRLYLIAGFEGLSHLDWKGSKPYLSEFQEQELSDFLDQNLHRDTNAIRAHIREFHQQYYSRSGCIKLMGRLGFEYRKPRRIPAQADEDKQREFIENYKQLQRHLAEDEAIYFADAVHPEHQSKPAYGWIKKGEKIALKSSSGRKRVNIHGAVNLENFDCPFVGVEKVNATSTIALFEKIEQRNPGKSCIFVFLDNARYHHARAVREWLAKTKSRIKPVFLPTYAPHLNPIERLWGVMHKYVTHNRFYGHFNDFVAAILDFFMQTVPKQWRNFRDRVTDNFRVIRHEEFRIL